MLITNGFFLLKALTILCRLYLKTYIICSPYIFSEWQWVENPPYGIQDRLPHHKNRPLKATGFGVFMLITNGFFLLKALTILYRLYLNPYIIGSSYIFSEWRWVE